MSPLNAPIRWSIGLAAGLLLAALPGVAGRALAHGGPEKVIDERFVVTVALAPDGDLTRLRFFFRDFRTGRGLTEPMSVRVRIAEDDTLTPLHENGSRPVMSSPSSPLEIGRASCRERVCSTV